MIARFFTLIAISEKTWYDLTGNGEKGDSSMEKIFRYHEKGNQFRVWHANNTHMILYLHSDGGSIVCSERNYPIRRGYLYFIGGAKFHYTLPDAAEHYERSKLFLPDKALQQLLPLLPEAQNAAALFTPTALVCAKIPLEEQEYVEQVFAQLKREHADPLFSTAFVRSSFLRLLIYLLKYSTDAHSGTGDAMGRAVEYINRHIGEELSIDRVCDAIHMSKFHFCRKFKEATSMTAMRYILKTRIIAAEELLRESDLPISAVSEKCGFSSESYFCRVFKEDTGLTPLQYRRNQKRSE